MQVGVQQQRLTISVETFYITLLNPSLQGCSSHGIPTVSLIYMLYTLTDPHKSNTQADDDHPLLGKEYSNYNCSKKGDTLSSNSQTEMQ